MQIDALWPLERRILDGDIAPTKHTPIHVLDIGLYLLRTLRAHFPHLTFFGFRRAADVPPPCVPVDLHGVGITALHAPSRMGALRLPGVREAALERFGLSGAQPRGILIISRNKKVAACGKTHPVATHTYPPPSPSHRPSTVPSHRPLHRPCRPSPHQVDGSSKGGAFERRALQDRREDQPDLHAFHSLGAHVYTAMHYLESSGAGRRTITNEHELLEGLQRTHGAAEEARLRV